MAKRYYINFDTNEMPGRIKATTVRLDTDVVRDMNKGLPVDLVDDPLYPQLERYVLDNPSGKIKRKST